jgi:hypothetical protein
VVGGLRVAWLVRTAVLLLAWPVAAQVRIGELSTHLTGTISPGYSAEYGNQIGSDHTWTFGGVGTFTGDYYSPNFLSFNSSFYLNQSRANSNFQSISNASGLTVSSNIFGGSHFPGSINYSKAYNSDGNYAIPGVANYVTHGNSDTFGINWSENLPNSPSFSAGLQLGSSQYSVYGTNDEGNNAFKSLNLHSAYSLAGFSMGAFYSTGSAHSLIPQVVTDQAATETHAGSDAAGFSVTHRFPMQGSVSATISRSDWSSSYLGSTSSGTIDLFNAVAATHPTQKLSFTANASYSDNLSGQLLQTIVAAGGVVPGLNSNQTSDSFDLMGVATYSPAPALQASAFVERRAQTFLGESYGVNSYGGGLTYSRELMAGTFNGSFSIIENTNDQTSDSTLGFSTTESYSNQILGWHVNGTFGYAQNVQTLLVTYMNSYYNYSGNARRSFGKFNVSAGAGASRTGLTQQPGTTNTSETYNASLGFGAWLNANGSYSEASGQALTTGAGLVPVPVPSPILPSSLISLYGGKSYTVGLSSTPVKKLILAAAYAKATSDLSSDGLATSNQNDEFNTLLQYQARKLYFTSGYARLEQGFSNSGTQPAIVSSYYFGVSRWFNFF